MPTTRKSAKSSDGSAEAISEETAPAPKFPLEEWDADNANAMKAAIHTAGAICKKVQLVRLV